MAPATLVGPGAWEGIGAMAVVVLLWHEFVAMGACTRAAVCMCFWGCAVASIAHGIGRATAAVAACPAPAAVRRPAKAPPAKAFSPDSAPKQLRPYCLRGQSQFPDHATAPALEAGPGASCETDLDAALHRFWCVLSGGA